ncbi:MAG: isochorismatase family protein [bacterium]|nr:isochorismatase family protein [bacterium]
MSRGFLGELRFKVPVKTVEYGLAGKRPGLVIVDVLRGFCETGCGPLAPPVYDPEMQSMVILVNSTAHEFYGRKLPIIVLKDLHKPGVPEPPYPTHCEEGSGQEELMPELKWTEDPRVAEVMPKDCINGFVGGIEGGGHSKVLRWVARENIDTLVVVGDCTDICVLDFVATMLSVRNHRIFGDIPLAGKLKDVVVYVPACATYDLPRNVAEKLGLPPEAAHPRNIMQHMGLKIMADRGAILAHELIF